MRQGFVRRELIRYLGPPALFVDALSCDVMRSIYRTIYDTQFQIQIRSAST
jgi:hypothetical protein